MTMPHNTSTPTTTITMIRLETGPSAPSQSDEEGARRLAWIRHSVLRGDVGKAWALGWNGDMSALGLKEDGTAVAALEDATNGKALRGRVQRRTTPPIRRGEPAVERVYSL